MTYDGDEVSWQSDQDPDELDALTRALGQLAEKYRPS